MPCVGPIHTSPSSTHPHNVCTCASLLNAPSHPLQSILHPLLERSSPPPLLAPSLTTSTGAPLTEPAVALQERNRLQHVSTNCNAMHTRELTHKQKQSIEYENHLCIVYHHKQQHYLIF